MLALVALLAALAGRLVSGPVFTEIGTGEVAERLAASLGPGTSAQVGVLGIGIAGDLRPELHLRDLRIRRGGGVGLSADTVTITTGWGALLGGVGHVERVVADHVFVETAASDAPLPTLPKVLASIDAAVSANRVGYLEIGSLSLAREGGDRRTLLDKASVTAAADGGEGLSVTLAGLGAGGAWTVRASVGPQPGQPGQRRFELAAADLDLADLAAMAGAATPPAVGPVGFRGDLVTEAGRLVGGSGELTAGPIRTDNGADALLLLDRSRLQVSFDPAARALVIEPSPVVLAEGHALLRGSVAQPEEGRTDWRYRFEVHASEGAGSASGALSGSYDPATSLLVVDELRAGGEGASFAAAMRVTHEGGRIAGALSGVFPSLTVDRLKTIWPSVAVADARRWVAEHVDAGLVRDATVDVSFSETGIDAAEGGSAALAFRFEGLAFRPIDDGPLIRDAVGTGRLDGTRFEILMESGTVDMEDGRTLSVDRGRFTIADIRPEPTMGEAEIALSGPAAAAVALWQRLPLSDGVDLPATPETVAGDATATVTIRLPLEDDVKREQVDYGGRIEFRDLQLKDGIEGRTFSDGDIGIDLAGGVATIAGTAVVDGLTAEIDLTRPLEGEGGRSAVTLSLDAAGRKRLGLDVGDRVVGPITVRLQETGDGTEAQRATVDLSRAAVDIPELGFRKAKGKPGKAEFVIRKAGGRTKIDELSVAIGGARASGSLSLDEDGGLIAANLPTVVLSSGDRLSVKAVGAEDGVLDLTVTGSRFDARNLVASQLKRPSGGGEGGASMRLDVSLDEVLGFGEEALSGVNLAVGIADGRVTALSLAAQTGGGGSASMTMTPSGGKRRIEFESGEIGRVMRFLDLYGRITGGHATVTGVLGADGSIAASVDGQRWRIVDEPALARLSRAAADGPDAGFSTADIQRLQLDLRFANGVLAIDDGIVRAEVAGLTLQGAVDFRRDVLRLSGTYLPASSLDSLLGKIPILGQTVFAGGRAGLLGVTFRLAGPIDAPDLTANPLSVIAPGIFRRLFELR